jgi:SPW repeat
MLKLKHWQDVVNAVLGVWLLASPWALAYQGETSAMGNAVVVGIALAAAALGAILVPRAWEEWTELILGVWMIVSPWVLGFAAQQTAMITAVATGVVIAALALWTVLVDKDYRAFWQRGTQPH